jgi:N-acetylglucosamine-6-phosphate deacetylase
MRAATGWPLDQVWNMASATPARALGVAGRKGALRVGMDADLVVTDADLNVWLTMVGGQVVFQR